MNVLPAAALTAALALTLTGCSGTAKAEKNTPIKAVTAVTPDSCIEALDLIEDVIQGPVTAQNEDAILLTKQILKAYKAGLTGDTYAAQQIVATVEKITTRTKARTAEVDDFGAQYRPAAEECRSYEDEHPFN